MVTFDTLSDGYNTFTAYFTAHGSPVSELWGSRGMQKLFIDFIDNALNIITFNFEIFIALFIFLLMFALGRVVFGTLLHRYQIW